MKTVLLDATFVDCRTLNVEGHADDIPHRLVPVGTEHAVDNLASAQRQPRVRRQSRVLPDVYHALEEYRGFSLRYCSDPAWFGTVRVYVEYHPVPDYRGRDTNPMKIHMWPASAGVPPYICFKQEFAPTTYERARQLAEQWVDLTWGYITTGRTISEQISDDA